MIDLSFLKKFTRDDPKKLARYITLYLEVAPATFKEMQRNLINKNWEQLRINAHSLNPQADFMGITSLKDELIKIEEAVKDNNPDIIENLVNSSLMISTQSEQMLQKFLEEN